MSEKTAKKWLPLCLGAVLTATCSSVVWAQPEEEEEEPMQMRPNPMEQTLQQERQHTPMESSLQQQPLRSQELKMQGVDPGASVGKELGDGIVDPGKHEAMH